VRELVLTGIHLSSYGRDFKNAAEREDFGDGAANLLELLTLLDGVEGIERLRIGSLEPKIATPDFAAGLASLRHFCPHFHLSLQSGSNATLRRMGRRYTAEEFRAGVEALRAAFPDAAMTTDVIVGFPGESEEEFSESFSFIEEIRFYETHIFPYSKREGTKAAAMPEQVPGAVKKRRAALLQELNLERQREFRISRLGTEQEMLSEETVTIDGQAYLVGNSREYVKLAVPLAALGGDCAANCLYRGTAENFLNSEILLLTNVSKT
jgi:MiaB-like protein